MITLRPATPDDATLLAPFARDAFEAAFAHLYKPEDLAAFNAAERSEEKYAHALADPATRVQLAFVDGELAAYCLVIVGKGFAERPEPQPGKPLYFSQLYCAGDKVGLGLGATLMDWALGVARTEGCDAVQLSVWSENFGAQRFYQRHGFAKVADIEFWVGDQCDAEFLYELPL